MRAQKGEGINLSGREDGQIDTLRLSEHRNICIWGQDLRAVLTPGFAPRDRRRRCVWLRDVSVSHGQLLSALTAFKDVQFRKNSHNLQRRTN